MHTYLQLISYLIEKIKLCEINSTTKRNLAELEGIAPNLLSGMDATEYLKGLRTGEFPELEINPL